MENEKEILNFIDKTVGDPNYQTIEIKGKRIRQGYTKSWISWNNILSLKVSFENKSVCDIGCFLGYFCFKVEEEGAKKVVGYDKNVPAIEGARKISRHILSKCTFELQTIGKKKIGKRFGIILALNILHHVKRDYGEITYLAAIKDIFDSCSEVVFEVNQNELVSVYELAKRSCFKLKGKVASHRKTQFGDRFILHYIKDVEE